MKAFGEFEGAWQLAGLPARALRFGSGDPETDNACANGLPPGIHILTEEQLTMIIRNAVRCEMLRRKQTIVDDIVQEVGGEIDEQIDRDVRSVVGAHMSQEIAKVRSEILAYVKELDHASHSKVVHGPHIQHNNVTLTELVLGGFVHAAFSSLIKTVGGLLSVAVVGSKVERISGAILHKAPLTKHFHVSVERDSADDTNRSIKITFTCGEYKKEAAKLRDEAANLEVQAAGLRITASEADLKHASELESKAGALKVQADTLDATAGKWEAKVITYKTGDGELEVKE